MSVTLRFDFPPEVDAKRERLFDNIRALLTAQTEEGVRRAIALQRAWLEEYPGDYYVMDVGEALSKSEAASPTSEARAKKEAVVSR